MTCKVVLVDASLGNLRSVEKSLAHAGGDVTVSSDPGVIARAERLVVPGQGSFADCDRALGPDAPLGLAVRAFVASGRPYLGICLGLQALFGSSEEAPGARGLGLLAGRVVRIPSGMREPATAQSSATASAATVPRAAAKSLKVPHMGWNTVQQKRDHFVLPSGDTHFYFVHSFHAQPDEARLIAATASYGDLAITAAVSEGNLLGVQFHPEKSQRAGLALCERFLQWRP